MSNLLLPFLAVIATWWIGTGIVLYLQQRISTDNRLVASCLIATATFSVLGMDWVAGSTSNLHCYLAFVLAVILWGCVELSYYTGLITGAHQQMCPPDCGDRRRFQLALGASIWHELTVALCGVVLIALLWQEPNQTGPLTYLVLWLMRWAAKINLFLGVPNFNTDWFPKRLSYVPSYIRHAPITFFYPVSIVLALLCAWLLLDSALQPMNEAPLMNGLPGMLILLAILELAFMALPIADSALWNRVFGESQTY